MKKVQGFVFALILLAVCTLACSSVKAEFDAEQYTYDELVAIKEQIEERLEEIARQKAIENADRAFSFAEAEKVVFVHQRTEQQPAVTIIKEGAPAGTKFDWSSSDPKIAEVSAGGKVTGMSGGTAVITAAARDNPYLCASYTVHVAIPVAKITVWGLTEPLVLGKEEERAYAEPGYSIEPEDAYYQGVRWISSDETVVTIDETGKIHGLKPGKAILTAVSEEIPPEGRKPARANYEVTVVQAVTALSSGQESLVMNAGDSTKLEVAAMPEDASNRAVTFSSSDPGIASVDAQGTVRAEGCGECDILCEAADGYGASLTCHVKVSKLVTGLKFEEESIRMEMGGSRKIGLEIIPEDASDQRLIWTSTNVFVARAAGGIVEGVGPGECEITCTTTDGSNISASIRVRIPAFGVENEEYTVAEKQGLEIPVIRNRSNCGIETETEGTCFSTEWKDDSTLLIIPIEAGDGAVILTNAEDPDDTLRVVIHVENSAVFNKVSYPAAKYKELVTSPELFEGAQISIVGKILSMTDGEEGRKRLMIGTAGKKYSDQVITVLCGAELIPEGTEEGNLVTVYGLFRLEHDYSEVLQTDMAVPAMEAEKIVKK